MTRVGFAGGKIQQEPDWADSVTDSADPQSDGQFAQAIAALGWLSDQVELDASSGNSELAKMVETLNLARSYLMEFAIHKALGLGNAEALEATARRELAERGFQVSAWGALN